MTFLLCQGLLSSKNKFPNAVSCLQLWQEFISLNTNPVSSQNKHTRHLTHTRLFSSAASCHWGPRCLGQETVSSSSWRKVYHQWYSWESWMCFLGGSWIHQAACGSDVGPYLGSQIVGGVLPKSAFVNPCDQCERHWIVKEEKQGLFILAGKQGKLPKSVSP